MNQVQRMKLEIDELKQQVIQQYNNTNLAENVMEENKKENKEETSVQQPYKKKAIPKSLKMLVWHTYIGKEVGLAKCLCCKNKEITQMDFDCGHVVAESRGGVTTVNNMRPICTKCNRSMKAMDMNDFIEKYFYIMMRIRRTAFKIFNFLIKNKTTFSLINKLLIYSLHLLISY